MFEPPWKIKYFGPLGYVQVDNFGIHDSIHFSENANFWYFKRLPFPTRGCDDVHSETLRRYLTRVFQA